MSKPLTRKDQEKLLSFKPQILDPTSKYPKPYNGQRLPSLKTRLQRMRITFSRSKIHPKIQTQNLSSSYLMERLDSALTSLGLDFSYPLKIPGLDLQQIYPNLVSSHLSLLEINLHLSVARLDLVYLFPDQGETQVQIYKVSKSDPRLVPLATQLGKTQLLIWMTATVAKPIPHPIQIWKHQKNPKMSHHLTPTKGSWSSRKYSPQIQSPQAKNLTQKKIESREKPTKPTIPQIKRKKFWQNGKNS